MMELPQGHIHTGALGDLSFAFAHALPALYE